MFAKYMIHLIMSVVFGGGQNSNDDCRFCEKSGSLYIRNVANLK